MSERTILNRVLPIIGTGLLALAVLLAMSAAGTAGKADAANVMVMNKIGVKKCKKFKKKAKRKACLRKARNARKAGPKFYNPPKKLPKGHGKLIWQRQAGGAVPLQKAKWTRLVLYTSTSVRGKQVSVSGSLAVPKGKAPKGGWPLITYAHGTTGLADKCAPSRNKKNGPFSEGIDYVDGVINEWLEAGYAVARTDYEGLGTPGVHPFLVGDSEGRGVLDIVRAARQAAGGSGIKIQKKFLIAGHSQGGQAALFATGLAKNWVPDLTLAGTVAYAPASNFRDIANFLALPEYDGLTPIATMLIRGLAVAYPSVKMNEVVSDAVIPFLPDVVRECLPQLSEADSLGGIPPNQLLRDPVISPPESVGEVNANLLTILDEQNPGKPGFIQVSSPILLPQGEADTTTPPFLTNKLKTSLEAFGNDVTYSTYPGVDHFSILDESQEESVAFFQNRLPGGR